ncbi:MAG: LysR family transcriptional regulator [Phormidesmis sp.]
MRQVDLRGIDLNLLVLLNVLLRHRNVTKAAESMHMSQPAMSRALSKLRKLLNDPLLTRSQGGLVLTAKAIALHPALQQVLKDISHLVSDTPFRPEHLTGHLTLAASDHATITLLPTLMAQINQSAPELNVKISPLFNITAEQLHSGNIDMAFGVAGVALPSTLCQETLYEDTYATLMRKHHPVGRSLSVEQFRKLKHVLITAVGDGQASAIETALQKQGLQRRVALQVPSFIAALATVAQSDFVVTLPTSIARKYAKQYSLRVIAPPVNCPPISYISIWSNTRETDPAHQWLRQLVRKACPQKGLEKALLQ